MSRQLSRRSFFRGGLGGLAVVAGAGTLASCTSGSGTTPGNGSGNGSTVTLPNYVRFEGAVPDLPGTDSGVPDVFFAYPSSPAAVIDDIPGDGSVVFGSVHTARPVPPAVDRNAYWQEMNDRLGVDLQLSISPSGDYPQRFATAVAGNNLGDFFNVSEALAQLPQFFEAQCEDLTEYLSGDAIEEYPFLANIPSESWRGTIFNGAIFGIPVPRGPLSSRVLYTRKDLFDAKGVEAFPGNPQQLLEIAQDLTDPRANTWALSSVPMPTLQQMVGLPNNWLVEDGAFTNMIEMDAQKEALEIGRRLIADGLVHPDSIGTPVAEQKGWFNQGSAMMMEDTYTALSPFYQQNVAGDAFEVGLSVLTDDDGEPAPVWLARPNNSISALKKGDPARIRMILQILNWMAAPFGSEEYLFRKYGVSGVDYELEGTDPVLNQTGQSETAGGGFPIQYLTDAPWPVYYAGMPEVAQTQYDQMQQAIPMGISDPSYGLYSNTFGSVGGRLATSLLDATNNILVGREPVSSWDAAVEAWRADGGDAIRTEYEEAFAQNES